MKRLRLGMLIALVALAVPAQAQPGSLLRVQALDQSRAREWTSVDLGKQEAVLGATARLVSRTAPPVATVTVLSLDDRVMKLRFTVGGPPPPPQPASWPAAQALIVVRMSLVVLPKS